MRVKLIIFKNHGVLGKLFLKAFSKNIEKKKPIVILGFFLKNILFWFSKKIENSICIVLFNLIQLLLKIKNKFLITNKFNNK